MDMYDIVRYVKTGFSVAVVDIYKTMMNVLEIDNLILKS